MKKLALLAVLLFMTGTGLADNSQQNGQINILLTKPFNKAGFIKQRKFKLLSKPFYTKGVVLYSPDKGLIWDTKEPVRDVLFIGHKGISQLDTNTNRAVKIDNPVVKAASDVFVALVSLEMDKINRLFVIAGQTTKDGMTTIILQPKDENLKKAISTIEIRGSNRVKEIVIEETSGDSSKVTFSDEQFDNTGFSPAETELFQMM